MSPFASLSCIPAATLALCVGGMAAGAEPLFETTCVFPISPKNKPNCRIPSILLAPGGDILLICEKRTDGIGGTIGINTSECQFVELSNGDVRVISRNESSEDSPDNLRHLTAISRDGGVTWTDLHRIEELITPRCHGSVERFDAERLLFSGPSSPFRQKEHPYGCYNLTIRLSHDDGETWTAGKTIWPHPASYSDIVVLDDRTIAYIYERADKGSMHCWDELHFARFNLEWLTNGREASQ